MASGRGELFLGFHCNKWWLCACLCVVRHSWSRERERERERERGDFLEKRRVWQVIMVSFFCFFVFIVKRGVVCAHVRVVRHRLVCSREREREKERERGGFMKKCCKKA